MEQTQEVIQEKSAVSSPTGSVTKEKTSVSSSPGGMFQVQYLIYYIAGVIEILLALRFVFKLLGAASGSAFISLIYGISDVLVYPFAGIFSPAVAKGAETQSLFEPSTLIAMIVYALVAWGIAHLLGISNAKDSSQ